MRLALCGSLLAAGLCGQGPARIETIDGEQHRGELRHLDDEGILRIDGPEGTVRIPLDQLETATFDDAHPGTRLDPSAGRLILRSGLDAPARFASGDGRSATFDLGLSKGRARFDLRHLAAVRFHAARDGDSDGGFERALEAPPGTDDFLFATKADDDRVRRLSVRILAIDRDQVEVEFRGRPQSPLPIDQVYGVVFGQENGALPATQPKPVVELALHGGPTLHGKLLAWNGRSCRLRLDEGPELDLPCAIVDRIQVRSGRVAYLSDLSPSVEQTPAFDRVHPWLRDRAPGGEGFQLGGKSYRRGLCLVPRTTLTYRLTPGEYDRFESVIGIDDRSSSQAHAVFRVLADGQVVFEADAVTLGQPPRELSVPLAGVEKLTLQADFGKNFDLGDHCVFAAARLLKN